VSDEIPKAMTVVSNSPGGRRNGDQVVWDLGTIPAGKARTVQVVMRAGAGTFTNVVTAKADHDLQQKTETETLFETPTQRRDPSDPDKKKWYTLDKPTVMVEIEKTADPVDVGAEATYTVRILNPMSQADTNLRLTITLPAEMTVLDERGPTQGKRAEQKITFDKLPVLGPGQESAYSVKVQAAKAGVVQIRAEVASDSLPAGTPVTVEEKATILQPK
jgi:hypothetical protein